MYRGLQDQSSAENYQWMTQTLIPRPIAWVLSAADPEKGSLNLAPFSFFNAVTSDPPTVMLSVGKRPDGRDKDTRHNLQVGAPLVIHIPSLVQAEAVNQSAKALEPEESEVSWLGAPTVEWPDFPLPRLAEPKVAMSGYVSQVVLVGRQDQAMILVELQELYVADEALTLDEKGRSKVRVDVVNPLARLGASEYAGLGQAFQLKRPG